MKKIRGICLIAILLISCNSNEVSTVASKIETEEIVMESYETDRYDLAENVDQLFTESDLIMRGTIKTNEQVDLIEKSTGRIAHSYFRTNLDVTKVYKGDSKIKNIDMTEEYYFNNNILWTQEGYNPAVEGNEYILFLKAYDIGPYVGMYFPIDLSFGKYVIPNTSSSSNDLEVDSLEKMELSPLMTKDEVKRYNAWYTDIAERLKLNEKEE